MKKITLFVFLAAAFNAKTQNLQWAKSMGASFIDRAQSITVDVNKNVITTGFYTGTADFNPGVGVLNLTSVGGAGQWDVFIQKLDSLGNFIWAKSIGGVTGYDKGQCIKTDPSGNIFVTGSYDGTVDFDPNAGIYNLVSNGGYSDGFILKLDPAGNLVWAKSFGGSNTDNGNNVNIDAFGNVIVSGGFQGTVDFDPSASTYTLAAVGTSSTSPGNQNGFILKLDGSGNFVWAGSISGGGFSPCRSTVTDALGNLYITGNFNGTKDFDMGPGTYTLTASGQSSSFVMKVNSNGNFVWAKSSGQGPNSQGNAIDKDALGNIYVAGNYIIAFDFGVGTTTLNTVGGTDIYIMKLDTSGNFIWSKSVGSSSGYDDGNAMVADASGNTYITGYFGATGDFDPNIGIHNLIYSGTASSTDAYTLKLNSNGDFVWANNLGATVNNTWAWAIAVDNNSNLYTCGSYQGTVDFDPNTATYTLSSVGSEDIYIQKFSQDVCSNMALSIVSATNITCAVPNGQASILVVNGNAPYSYSWVNNSSTTTVASFTASGIYSVTVVDAMGCSKSSAVLINGPLNLNDFDLNANLVAPNFVPGVISQLNLDAFNDGCISTSGKLKLVLDPTFQTFISSVPITNLISGDTLIWDFNNISYGTAHITPTISVATKTTANIGDTICLRVIITPISGDVNPLNNDKNYCYPVVSSYDPNDKQVYPKGACSNGQILNNQLLTYTVRFQNTGTFMATNIMVKDSLDTDIDLNSIRVIGNSHPVVTEVSNGKVLKFHFNGINLADAASNEPQSHGYVIFEAKPVIGLANNTEIKNNVGIYFDFNAPILTNTVLNTVVNVINCGVSTDLSNKINSNDWFVYPNPASDFIKIQTSQSYNSEITIFDILGKQLKGINSNDSESQINISDLNNGVYIIKIVNEGRIFNQKIVIQR